MRIGSPPCNLLEIAQEALGRAQPRSWLRPPARGTALICWGKGAQVTAQVLRNRLGSSKRSVNHPTLILGAGGPGAGEHPIPGPGSFANGLRLIEFFDELGRSEVNRLDVFLSGGASSLAWLPYPGMSRAKLEAKLSKLYAQPLPIAELNARRSEWCQLKAGGAACWLAALAPRVRVRVWVVSDVLPFGPEIVGSGPFWNGVIEHQVVADNAIWVREIARIARARKLKVLEQSAGGLGQWQVWVGRADDALKRVFRERREGLLVFGGEPQVRLSHASGRGGRQTQIAAALLAKWSSEIAAGKVEILCLSSDGVDGKSGAAGAWLRAETGRRADGAPELLRRAVSGLDSASPLRNWSALVPTFEAGTNVQDVVLVLVRPGR